MNRKRHALALMLSAIAFTAMVGCSNPQITDATSRLQSQGAPILTDLSKTAQELGEKAREAANNAVDLINGFLGTTPGPGPVDGSAFEKGWTSLKQELQSMADNATSPETKAKISALMTSLEAQVKDITAKITANENVQEIQAAITDFWTQARQKIDEIRK